MLRQEIQEMESKGPWEMEITEEEIRMFEHIEALEATHNEMGKFLTMFKDDIMAQRNKFFLALSRRYRYPNPNLVRYDPLRRKIVSIFHPGMNMGTIKEKPPMFSRLASELIFKAIETLLSVYKARGTK